MNKNIGFIGCGKMAQAMIEGLISSGTISKERMMASAFTDSTISLAIEKFDIQAVKDNKEVASFSDILFLAVKPIHYGEIMKEIKECVKQETLVITIAAGVTLADVEEAFGRKVKAVRTMPNTPSLVGEGMSVICPNSEVTKEEVLLVQKLFNSFGKSEILEEKLMDVVPAISGSSPAYVYMFIEALADGGVKHGIPRKQAYRLAAQAVLGAAKMVLETESHPGELKDNVCTPGGATIEAVAELEKKQFRGTIISAMEKCFEKTKAMSNG